MYFVDKNWRKFELKISYTESGEVYTWGWKECVPSGKVIEDPTVGSRLDKDVAEQQGSLLTEQGDWLIIW